MKILIACEESQEVCKAFREKGHEAYSCDIKDCSGGHPEWHIKGNCLDIINNGWDLIIAHPPCTYLSNAGACRLYKNGNINKNRYQKGLEAAEFFLKIYNADCKRICIENPVPLKIYNLPLHSQIIQPYEFGENYKKKTYLWLKGLPYLIGQCYAINTKNIKSWTMETRNPAIRAKTFPGIAKAMAQQWGNF